MYKIKYYLLQDSAFKYYVVKEVIILWIRLSYEYVNQVPLTKHEALKLMKLCQKTK